MMKTAIENTSQNCDKETLTVQKARMLKEYKSYEKDLEFASNDYEKGLITAQREKLALKIKALGAQIREIEVQES